MKPYLVVVYVTVTSQYHWLIHHLRSHNPHLLILPQFMTLGIHIKSESMNVGTYYSTIKLSTYIVNFIQLKKKKNQRLHKS